MREFYINSCATDQYDGTRIGLYDCLLCCFDFFNAAKASSCMVPSYADLQPGQVT